MKKTLSWFSAPTLLVLLSACGGGGGGGGGDSDILDPPPTAGIGRTGIAAGPISTFGSVVVNGVRYDTSSATFSVDGEPGTEDDLKVGDYIIVKGTKNDDGTTGTANEIIYDDLITGPVDSVDLAAGSLVVLGQTIIVTAETSFDDDFAPASLEGVSVAQIVEVSGQFDANGDIVASRIEPEAAGTPFEVHGIVSMLDETNATFMLGDLLVDYSAATLDDFPGGQISNDDYVEAKGSALGASGELLASIVEFESPYDDIETDDYAELEGYITTFVDAEAFSVAGFPVTTTAQTEYDGGTEADLALNVKVEVEGTVNANGVLVAEEIEFRDEPDILVSALVDSVDAANNSAVLLGITVTIDALTRLEDKSPAELDPLTLADISAGDYLQVRGREAAGSGEVVATLLERDEIDDESELSGFVSGITEPSFTVLGVTIETSGTTVFRDSNEAVISSAEFFSLVSVGALVEAEGIEVSDQTIAATEVELDD